jgi:hypothetical protein
MSFLIICWLSFETSVFQRLGTACALGPRAGKLFELGMACGEALPGGRVHGENPVSKITFCEPTELMFQNATGRAEASRGDAVDGSTWVAW